MSTGVLHGPAEPVGRALHDLVQDAGCIFVPVQISSSARYLIFDFSKCPGVQMSFLDTTGHMPSKGYIRGCREIVGLCQ